MCVCDFMLFWFLLDHLRFRNKLLHVQKMRNGWGKNSSKRWWLQILYCYSLLLELQIKSQPMHLRFGIVSRRVGNDESSLGVIHKPRGHGGGGVSQMSVLLHELYSVKWSTKGEVGQKCPKNCPHGLWMVPYTELIFLKTHFLQNPAKKNSIYSFKNLKKKDRNFYCGLQLCWVYIH